MFRASRGCSVRGLGPTAPARTGGIPGCTVRDWRSPVQARVFTNRVSEIGCRISWGVWLSKLRDCQAIRWVCW